MSYPFGHGLSYTTFEYGDLVVSTSGSHDGGDLDVTVSCSVTNTGTRAGTEVVQLYVSDPEASVSRPVRELEGFVKVGLEPGATTTATFHLDSRAFSFWSTAVHEWVLEAGSFGIAVGASSRDLRLHTDIDLAAARVAAPLGETSTLEEWLADPAGSALLKQAFGTDSGGKPQGILGDPQLLTVIGNFPMNSLTAFPGIGLDAAALTSLLDAYATGADRS